MLDCGGLQHSADELAPVEVDLLFPGLIDFEANFVVHYTQLRDYRWEFQSKVPESGRKSRFISSRSLNLPRSATQATIGTLSYQLLAMPCMIGVQCLSPLQCPSRPTSYIAFYAFLDIFFSCFLFPFSLSLSRNFRCSSALMPFNLESLISFFFLSLSSFLSSAFSVSPAFCSLRISSSRVARSFRWTSARKCALETRVSGRRKNCENIGRLRA